MTALSPFARRAMILLVGAFLLWASWAVTASLIFGRKAPSAAVMLGYRSATAQAAFEVSQLGNAPQERVDAIVRSARSALASEPLSVDAAVALGTATVLQQQESQARRAFAYSERLSRRNIPTQLWLIEDSVQRGAIDQALVHYDRAMRVSVATRALLLPILTQAAATSEVVRPLARLLSQRPLWWPAAVEYFIAGPNPERVLPATMAALNMRPTVPAERAYLVSAMKRLVDAGDARAAFALDHRARGSLASQTLVRNGDFEVKSALPPFDWELKDSAELAGVIQSGDGGSGQKLFLFAASGQQGEVARQVLMLAPRRYRLQATVGNIPAERTDRPHIALGCLSPSHQVLLDMPFPAAAERGLKIMANLTVPAGCAGQMLQIRARASLDGAGGSAMPWIDDIQIVPLSAQ